MKTRTQEGDSNVSPESMRVRYDTAPTSLAIKIVSATVIVAALGLLVASFWQKLLLIPTAVLSLVLIGCYLRAPVAYHVSSNGLIVEFRLGQKQFGRILGCTPVQECTRLTLRLWGNGGLFAGTGIFWNRTWGIFRAYVTTSGRTGLVLVETEKGKVLVSPHDRGQFVKTAASFGHHQAPSLEPT